MRSLAVAVIALLLPCTAAHASTPTRPTTSTTGTQVDRGTDGRTGDHAADQAHHRNYFADAVAFVLAVIAAALLVRRRRSVFKTRR